MSNCRFDLALIVNSNSYGGTERHTIDLLHEVHNSSVNSIFLYSGNGLIGHLPEYPSDMDVSRVESKVQDLNLSEIKTWNTVLKNYRAKRAVLIKPSYFSIDLKLLFLVRRIYKNLIVIEHSLPPRRLPLQKFGLIPKIGFWRIRDELKRYLFAKLVDDVITVSEISKQELERHTFYKNVKVCSNGINLDYWMRDITRGRDFRANHGINSSLHLFACVGNLFTIKSFDVAIQALSLISNKNKNRCALCIVGVGPEEENLKQLAAKLNVKNVFFVGKQFDMVAVYSAVQTLLVTSRSESASLSLLEATACDCRVLASNVGICAEVLKEVQNGEIIYSHDPVTWAKAIERHLDRNTFSNESPQFAPRTILGNKYDTRKTMNHLLNTIMSDN